jgi:hypothetical protein
MARLLPTFWVTVQLDLRVRPSRLVNGNCYFNATIRKLLVDGMKVFSVPIGETQASAPSTLIKRNGDWIEKRFLVDLLGQRLHRAKIRRRPNKTDARILSRTNASKKRKRLGHEI